MADFNHPHWNGPNVAATITEQQITDEIISIAVDALNTSGLSKVAEHVIVRFVSELDGRGRITVVATYCDLVNGERSYELILRVGDVTPTTPEYQPVEPDPVLPLNGVGVMDNPPGDAA